MNIYLQGLTMGLAYVAPIGLQNLFVINSALTQRRSRVYLTALIVILWDVSLGVSCFLGAGALMQAVPWLQKVILGLGSLPAGGDLPFICGFGSASVIWFLTLSTIVSLLGSKFNEKVLNIINKVCGGVIIFYGCKLIWNFVQLMGWVK